MRNVAYLIVSGAVLGSAFLVPGTAAALPSCTALATDPANGLAGNPFVKSASGVIIPPAGANASYCQVNILYGQNPNQNINIRVGLPLSSLDGGTGGVQGAWNGRTQGVGGGGCSGTLAVTAPVNARYVGSGTDGGHSGAANNCEPAVNLDGTYNVQYIQDWSRNGIKQQILSRKPSLKPITTGRRCITTGMAARPAAVRATCSRRSSAMSSMASWPTRRRSTGRGFRRRRCGDRSS